jgi:hypothetical protein
MATTDALEQRLRAIEDELAVRRLIVSYGPSADAAHAPLASTVFTEDGDYDWDAEGEPYEGRAAIEAMFRGDGHRRLVSHGIAHFIGPPYIELDGDRATALSYSMVMRRDPDGRFYLWRVSAVRWDVERRDGGWQVRRRTNRLLDDSSVGSELFSAALTQMRGVAP